MIGKLRSRIGLPSPSMLVALCALMVATGGVAFGAIRHTETGVITGCYEKRTGELRVINAQAGRSCKTKERTLTWNHKGAKGDSGANGAQGAKGDSGAKGAQGAQGAAGTTGPAGPGGPKGEMGPAGTNGTNGTNGVDGTDGAACLPTNPACVGPEGPAGPDGPAGAAPAGAVSFFNLATCPAGWSELTAARGRYIVGLPTSGTLAAAVGTALANSESRAVGLHSHGVSSPSHSHAYNLPNAIVIQNGTGANGSSAVSGPTFGILSSNNTTSASPGITVQNAGEVAGTNAPYIQLLTCQKA